MGYGLITGGMEMQNMNTRFNHGSSKLGGMLGLVVGLAVWGLADTAAAASTCYVDLVSNDIGTPGTLPYCVDQVNQGTADVVNIRTFQWYAPDDPLVFEQSATVIGPGRIVMPGDQFVGDSLFVIGTACPGAGCAGQAVVDIVGLEIAAAGFGGVRGIDVLPHHELTIAGVQVADFDAPR